MEEAPTASTDSPVTELPPKISDTPATESNTNVDNDKPPSKRSLKRLMKQKLWEEKKQRKRLWEKQRRKELPPEARKVRGAGKRRRKFKKMKDSDCKIQIVVDLSFDRLMTEKDVGRCANQVNRCYSYNRALENPTQFQVTSFIPDGPSFFAMAKQDGYRNWDVVFHQKPYDQVYEKSKIVYLSSDSRNVLRKLEEDKVYIIGGLVDHNSKKGLCHQLAIDKGIAHARLPISEYIELNSRCVLSINQVFAILANVSQGMEWKEAIVQAIPQRKMAKAKNGDSQSDEDDDNDNDNNGNDDSEEAKNNDNSCDTNEEGGSEQC